MRKRANGRRRFILPDVHGVEDGAFDMARTSRLDMPPPPTGDVELDMLISLIGLHSHDGQGAHQSGYAIETPAGSVPIGLALDPDGEAVVARCLQTLAARKMWLTMLRAVGADPAHPPAWATTISVVAANLWRARGGKLGDLHTRTWARHLARNDPFEDPQTDVERRVAMLTSFVEIPDVDIDGVAVTANPTGSRMRMRIVSGEWALVDAAWLLVNVDGVEPASAAVVASKVGRPLSETLKSGSIPILGDIDPVVVDLRFSSGGAFILVRNEVVTMGPAPRAALQAVGLDEVPPGSCPWFVAARQSAGS